MINFMKLCYQERIQNRKLTKKIKLKTSTRYLDLQRFFDEVCAIWCVVFLFFVCSNEGNFMKLQLTTIMHILLKWRKLEQN